MYDMHVDESGSCAWGKRTNKNAWLSRNGSLPPETRSEWFVGCRCPYYELFVSWGLGNGKRDVFRVGCLGGEVLRSYCIG